MGGELKLFSGRGNEPLAQGIARSIGIELDRARVGNFADGEPDVQFLDDVRDQDVFIVQSTQAPADNFFKLLIMIRAARSASAGRVTAVIPYFWCTRQDKKDEPRVAITAKLAAELLVTAGVQHVILLDLHAQQEVAFFDETKCVIDHLFGSPLIIAMFRTLGITDRVFGPPDAGRNKRPVAI